MRSPAQTSPGRLPAIGATSDLERPAVPPTGPDRRAFICGALLAGTVVAIGWPGFGGGEEADWSDGTAWSDGLGWSS